MNNITWNRELNNSIPKTIQRVITIHDPKTQPEEGDYIVFTNDKWIPAKYQLDRFIDETGAVLKVDAYFEQPLPITIWR